MQNTPSSETLNLASQTLPLLMITVTFICIAALYGHTTLPSTSQNVFESSKINFGYLF